MYARKQYPIVMSISNLVLASPGGAGVVNSTTVLVPGQLYGVRPRAGGRMIINPTTIDMTGALENGISFLNPLDTFIFRAQSTRLQTYSTAAAVQWAFITYRAQD